MRLKDKVAIITGGGRGIGRAVAIGFAKEGASIVIASRTESELLETLNQINSMGSKCLSVVCDVTNENQVKLLVEKTLDEFGKLDILINNAGIGGMRPVYAVTLESFQNIINVNLTGTFLCTKHSWQPMVKGGGGSIINVSSLGGLVAYPYLSAYCASKWGQIGFTKACAEEGKKDNIRVNAIAPGKGDTKIRSNVPEDKSKLLKAEDHISSCVFLASDESKYITGQVIPIEKY